MKLQTVKPTIWLCLFWWNLRSFLLPGWKFMSLNPLPITAPNFPIASVPHMDSLSLFSSHQLLLLKSRLPRRRQLTTPCEWYEIEELFHRGYCSYSQWFLPQSLILFTWAYCSSHPFENIYLDQSYICWPFTRFSGQLWHFSSLFTEHVSLQLLGTTFSFLSCLRRSSRVLLMYQRYSSPFTFAGV